MIWIFVVLDSKDLRMIIEQTVEYISEHNSKLYCLYTLTENYDTIVIEASKVIL